MRYFIFILALCFSLTASAQSVEQFRRGLLNATEGGGSVVVLEGDGVSEAVKAVETQRRRKVVDGFRIVIFSDNGQYAGDIADSVLLGFKERYPRVNAYLVYESPYFKVSVGDCLSMEEAQILMAKIQGSYPKAFPRRESVAMEALTTPLIPVAGPVDSLALPIVVEE
ncbi:MAG: hypothetical protein IKY51_01670 [Alistipes sp.]|nr:hypothetical protein [Alistipes sp.]